MSRKNKVVYRRALPEDKTQVLAINENVYDGADYLPGLYDIYMQAPNIHCLVAEVDGRLVGFGAKLVIEGGEAELNGAGRVSADYQGKGILQELGDHGLNLLQNYPNLKYGLSALHVKRIADKIMAGKIPGMRVIQSLHFLMYKTNWAMLESLSMHAPSEIPTSLQPSQMDCFLTEDRQRARLFPDGFLKAYVTWIPYRSTASNLKTIAQNCQTFYSKRPDDEMHAVSFGHLCKNKPNAILYDIVFYHWKDRPATAEEKALSCCAHIIAHAKHFLKISSPCDNHYILLFFPTDIDVEMVKRLLIPSLGRNERSDDFCKDDFAFLLKRDLTPSPKL